MKKLGFWSSKLLRRIQPLLTISKWSLYIDLWAPDGRSKYWWSTSLAIIISLADQKSVLAPLKKKLKVLIKLVPLRSDILDRPKYHFSRSTDLLLEKSFGLSKISLLSGTVRSGRNFLCQDKNVFCSNQVWEKGQRGSCWCEQPCKRIPSSRLDA